MKPREALDNEGREYIQVTQAANAVLRVSGERYDRLWLELMRTIGMLSIPDVERERLEVLFNFIHVVRDAHEDAHSALLKVASISLEHAPELVRSAQGRSAAKRRVAADPKQEAKKWARKLWEKRRAGERPDLRTNVQFAIEVMRQWQVLKNPQSILNWASKWEREARDNRAR